MIELDRVGFSYNGKRVLESVSLRVEAEEFVGVLGPNGAGKSTLLKLMSKWIAPLEGRVLLRGIPLSEIPVRELAREMAVLPAETFLAYDFTVMEIVKMGRAPHLGFWSEGGSRDLEIVRGALEAVGIEHLAQRRIRSLSSGERQMAFLAQAMAQEPRILLLDEPTVHLDIQHQIRIFKLLKEWNERRKLTVLVISHDLNIASHFCKRLVLIHHGAVVSDGGPKEVITPENIRTVYGIDATVVSNPQTGLPALLFE